MAKAPSVTVWIAQPGARSDEAVEKLTELGVARIGALRSDLLKTGFTANRIERWKRVAEAAAKQSKQAAMPEILGIASFGDVLSPEAVVLSHEGASGRPRRPDRRSPLGHAADRAGAGVLGCRARSGALARRRGQQPTFGPVVLRTETAAIVAAALALREMGFLG